MGYICSVARQLPFLSYIDWTAITCYHASNIKLLLVRTLGSRAQVKLQPCMHAWLPHILAKAGQSSTAYQITSCCYRYATSNHSD